MTSIYKKLPLSFIFLVVSSCGGNSSAINKPTITLVSPVSTVVAAGSTLQLQATVGGSNNTTILWYVNNVPGGNSTVGTITPQGFYTAPNIPTSNGSIVISASPQVYPTISTSIQIGITFANVSLSGNYVFSMSGTESGGPWAAAGSFTANGNGTISNGIEDINGPAGISTALPFNGSFLINANGQGIAAFTSAQGSVTMAFTLNTQGQSVVMRTDHGDVATGLFYPQLPTALTLTSLNASYVFSFAGVDQSSTLQNVIGYFNTNGSPNLTNAQEDLNDGSTTTNQSFSGSYTIVGNGRGTATFTDSTGTRTYGFYIVSPTQLQFVEIDTSGYLNGTVFQQQSVTPTTTLAGSYVFDASGISAAAAYATAGGFYTNTTTYGNISSGTDDINNAGTNPTNTTLTGSFTTGTNGRGTIILTGTSGTTNYVYYFISPNTGFLLSTDNGINASGNLFQQIGGFSTAALFGSYTLIQSSPVSAMPPSAAVGVLNLNGAGAIAGYQNMNINGTSSGQLSVTGTEMVTGVANGTSTRGVATLSNSAGTITNYAFYPISSSAVIMLGDSGSLVVATLVSQY
ncbi:MAG TPA: hypothetical protein VNI53_00180 [Gammaproteobacteria bacterium]|nr:hypothetical protein [Gammaproteobacteria bacterium]